MKYKALLPYKFKSGLSHLTRRVAVLCCGLRITIESGKQGTATKAASRHTAGMILSLAFSLLCIAMISSCGTQSRKMAGEGAATGAVVGAVGGMVSALVFGGDVGESAARGAVWGGSTGAAAGAIAGAQVDTAQKKAQQEAELERLRMELGEDGFKGLEALADCKHEIAIAYARTAARSSNEDYSLAGLWIEVLALGDLGDTGQARALFPNLVSKDPEIGTDAQAEEAMQKSLQQLQEIRAKYNLPKVCS